MSKKKKTQSELILDTLMTGNNLLLKEITKMASEASAQEVKIQSVSNIMTKLSDPGRSSTGHFIIKNKTPEGYAYSLVPEILNLAPEEIYGLTRKTGKDRFTLKMAVQKIPELEKYAQKTVKTAGRKKSAAKKPGKKGAVSTRSVTPKGRPAKVTESETPEEPAAQKTAFMDLKDSFQEGIQRIGGLRIKFHFTAKILKR